MKMWKKVLGVAALALCLTAASKVDSQAAGQVTGVKQTGDSQSSVQISWDSVLDASTKYYITQVSTDGNSWYNREVSSGTNDYVSSLAAGQTYYVRVIGYNDYTYEGGVPVGEGSATAAASNPVEVVTAPSGSIDATQTASTTTGVTVSSTGLAGANYYRLTYEQSGTKLVLGESATPVVSSSIALTPATSYWMHYVTARKAATTGYIAEGSYDYAYFKTLMNKIGDNNFGITNIWSNINSYNFGISASGAYDGVSFQFATMSGKVKKTQESSGSYVGIGNFINGTFYKYRVRTYVNCGTGKAYSAWSNYKYIGMSKTFKGTSTKKAIRANWSKVSGATKYVVYVSTKENSGYKKVKTVSAKKRSVSITKVNKKRIKKGKKYYVKVVAQSKVGKKTVSSGAFWRGDTTIPRY